MQLPQYDSLATVRGLVHEQGRNRKFWRYSAIDAVQNYLLLLKQQESDVSIYRIDEDGDKVPLFHRSWLSARMSAFENDDFFFTASYCWERRVRWASPKYFGAVVRSTITDFQKGSYQRFGNYALTAGTSERNLEIGVGTKLRPYWQFLYSASGELVSQEREYPGWVLDTLAH